MTEGILREPGSFRDPSGFIFTRDDTLYRSASESYLPHYLALHRSGLYDDLVAEGALIPHDECDPADFQELGATARVLRPERIPFVSYPYEWSFSALRDAALLTLEVQERALARGLWLKDASAYNIQFRGSRPVLIDTLSFETYPEGQPWVAYQQFCRHFLGPLALMAYRDVGVGKLLRAYIDGLPLELVTALLPKRAFLRPGLLAHLWLHARAIRAHSDSKPGKAKKAQPAISAHQLRALVLSLRSSIEKLSWSPDGTEWSDYYADTNYSDQAGDDKSRWVSAWIDAIQPSSVWDLGANTGVYSRLASNRGIQTVAFDIDPGAVEKSYRDGRTRGDAVLLPLVMDLANPSPDLGWAHAERKAMLKRGPADLCLALALVHHLAIGNNVPLQEVARFFARAGRHLVIEFIPKEDSQVQRLLASREDVFPGYHQEGFEAAFREVFRLRARKHEADSLRTIYWWETA